MHFCAGQTLTCHIRLYGKYLAASDSFALLGRYFCLPANDREPLLNFFKQRPSTRSLKLNWLKRLQILLPIFAQRSCGTGQKPKIGELLCSEPGSCPPSAGQIPLITAIQDFPVMKIPTPLAHARYFAIPTPSNDI